MSDVTITRRALLAGTAAVATAAVLPALSTPAPAVVAPAAEPLPMWAVGTPGEFDWNAIRAPTEEAARRAWALDRRTPDEECAGGDNCECDVCIAFRSSETERQPGWDGLERVTRADWLRAGMGAICSRCESECCREDGAHPIGAEAVCEECMTIANWEVVDPARAAELREELEDA